MCEKDECLSLLSSSKNYKWNSLNQSSKVTLSTLWDDYKCREITAPTNSQRVKRKTIANITQSLGFDNYLWEPLKVLYTNCSISSINFGFAWASGKPHGLFISVRCRNWSCKWNAINLIHSLNYLNNATGIQK